MKRFFWFLIAGFIFIFSGCSTARLVSTEQEPGFSLINYSSYNYLEVEIDTIDLSEFNKRIKWIAAEIDSQFETRGIKRSMTDPDLLVNVGLVFVEKMQTRESDYRTDGAQYMGSRSYSYNTETVDVGKYQEGTFVMHLVDAKTKVLMWEGILQGVALENDKKSQKNIVLAVNTLFKNLD